MPILRDRSLHRAGGGANAARGGNTRSYLSSLSIKPREPSLLATNEPQCGC